MEKLVFLVAVFFVDGEPKLHQNFLPVSMENMEKCEMVLPNAKNIIRSFAEEKGVGYVVECIEGSSELELMDKTFSLRPKPNV